MSLLKPQKLEDYIVKLLVTGEKNTTALLSEIQEQKHGITKQGFYAALRKLRSEEIILVYKRKASLNTVWIKKMDELFTTINKTYTIEQKTFDVLGLEDKESVSYSFSNTKNLDIFWGHSQNIIIRNTGPNEPIYAYDPHYWFYIARKETETELLKEIVQNKRQFLMTVGGKLHLDQIIKSDFNSDYLQYNYKRMFEEDNYYVTVIGDYITEVYLDENISEEIDRIYLERKTIDQDTLIKLKGFLEKKSRNKIKISKNISRAQKLKTKIGKDFYIKPTSTPPKSL